MNVYCTNKETTSTGNNNNNNNNNTDFNNNNNNISGLAWFQECLCVVAYLSLGGKLAIDPTAW